MGKWKLDTLHYFLGIHSSEITPKTLSWKEKEQESETQTDSLTLISTASPWDPWATWLKSTLPLSHSFYGTCTLTGTAENPGYPLFPRSQCCFHSVFKSCSSSTPSLSGAPASALRPRPHQRSHSVQLDEAASLRTAVQFQNGLWGAKTLNLF